MSAPEVDRIIVKLDGVLMAIDELKAQYREQDSKLQDLGLKLALLNAEHCRIQIEKDKRKTPWFNIVPSVISSILAALVIFFLALR